MSFRDRVAQLHPSEALGLCLRITKITLALNYIRQRPLCICILFFLSFFLSLLSVYLSIALQPFVGPWPLFQCLDLFTVARTPWTTDQPFARPLPAHRTAQTEDKSTQTSMPQVGFEPTIPVFERAKTVVLNRAATVIGAYFSLSVALVSKLTIPTEWPPIVGERSAKFYGLRVSRGQRNGFPRPLISVF
jgi:hypothetical protein